MISLAPCQLTLHLGGHGRGFPAHLDPLAEDPGRGIKSHQSGAEGPRLAERNGIGDGEPAGTRAIKDEPAGQRRERRLLVAAAQVQNHLVPLR